jgi:hypothetical protein
MTVSPTLLVNINIPELLDSLAVFRLIARVIYGNTNEHSFAPRELSQI